MNERTGEGIFARVVADPLSHRVLPDVVSYGFGGITLAEDVVVEFFLPEFAAMLLAIIVGRLLFEILNEVQQVSRGI